MKRDDAFFLLFLLLLLVAPKLPLSYLGLPDKSSLSFGIVGLIIWALFSPKHIAVVRYARAQLETWFLAVFVFYALAVSFMLGGVVSVAYALQYFIYVLLGFFLFSNYINSLAPSGRPRIFLSILNAVGIIFALGCIISIWTGPIYPHQVIFTARLWGELYIQQGVGFSENQNQAGGVLIFFASLALFGSYKDNRVLKFWPFYVIFLALLSTMSRSAVYSFLLSLSVWALLKLTRVLGFSKINKRGLWIIFGIFLFCLGAISAWHTVRSYDHDLAVAVAQGFDLSDEIFSADTSIRAALWQESISRWSDAGTINQVFGKGFRNSMTVDDDAWISAHNAYLVILGDFGIVGLALFLLPLIFLMIRLAGRILTEKTDSKFSDFAFVSLMGLLIHNMSEAFFYSPAIISITLLTMTISSLNVSRKRQVPE